MFSYLLTLALSDVSITRIRVSLCPVEHYNNNHCFTAIMQVSQHLQLRTGGFFGAKFYCPHALAGSNQRIWIRDKTPEFSSTVLSKLILSPLEH